MPAGYSEKAPDVLGRDVYLLDFSYPAEVVEEMLLFAKSVTLIDHHATAIDALWHLIPKGLNMRWCNLKQSGATLAWDYIQAISGTKEKLPRLLEHVQDRDLWLFELPGTKAILAYMNSFEFDFKVWNNLMQYTRRDYQTVAPKGEAILRSNGLRQKALVKQCTREIELCGYTVPLANISGFDASDVGAILSKGFPFSVTYFDTEVHRVFSLRSSGEFAVDVSEICKKFNGGGHKHAAGFKVLRDSPLAKL
jgi:oligoribonuclease NrnB/cAMP/cGMP phosphodiesterase (DHH superfamily)